MESAKIIKRTAICLLCLLALALIGLNIYQYQQIKKASQVLPDEPSSVKEAATNKTPDKVSPILKITSQAPAPVVVESQTTNKEADDLKYQLASAKEELAMANKQLSDETEKEAKEKKASSDAQKRSREMMKKYQETPAYRQNMRNSLAVRYPDLFEKLNLAPEKLEKFKDMLVDEMMAQQDLWAGMQTDDSTTLSKEQQAELNKRYEALDKEYESKKSELLGKDDYDKYQAYNETAGERRDVTNFLSSLGSGETLTGTQKETLIEAMHQERKSVVYDKINDGNSGSTSTITYDEKTIALIMGNEDRINEAYLKAAKNILSASQIEQLTAYLKQQRDMYESIYKAQVQKDKAQTTENSSDNKSK
jgi:hypothetical protein